MTLTLALILDTNLNFFFIKNKMLQVVIMSLLFNFLNW